ncbi:ATP-dependent DNA helicase RecQ [Adhaeribacter aerolatus]|uniref:DNA helicase RecQ n=1 Tax=Adhaeribacter aerolatus TaxID=670289 RepID=A0A512B1H0_9BACT|nr:DNA helicase RecQ [Adhaeribacter aerolatus]GEO05796.1 ATP-dependent DNA helicase RecQ [Adhaeribacter aerolatus]
MMSERAQTILKEYFGYDAFRPMQQSVIQTVLAGQDCLVLMPTGGGKSLCYQVPALVMSGICVVVSPLIALMKDQVEALLANGVPAGYLNSSLSAEDQYELENECLADKIKLLYVSPEKLLSPGFFSFLKRLTVNLFAIDEAHCISAWGHDFRPEYTQLKYIKEQFPQVPIVALTATADRLTRQDILKQLGLPSAKVFVSSFDRPNLNLTVLPAKNRFKVILDFLESHRGQPGIIYCLSRNSTEQLAQKLMGEGYKATAYHAGLPAQARSKAQEAFLKDNVQIVCATIAFGMGIDKSNVRWVIHYNLPKNIESYYQEIGRGGRDGARAGALLFYSYSDVMRLRDMFKEGNPEQVSLQIAKLDRMQQFAEAATCRRKILLQYFGETLEKDCGNCDNCRNPPATFDGTLLAQKALSAVARMQEKVNMSLLIDVLRGARNQAVLQKSYDKIKTYGAGRDLPHQDWQSYLHQFLNAGLLEMAYEEGYALKLNNRSREVLFSNQKVKLVKFQPVAEKEEEKVERRPKKEFIKDELFERLRALRKSLADERQVPPYVIFSDSTLLEMADEKPTNRIAMLAISGVGMVKFENYGHSFINEIIGFITDRREQGSKVKGATHLVTYEAYQKGLRPEQIAAQRNLNLVTIYSHLATLYEQNYDVNLGKYLTAAEYRILEDYFNWHGTDQNLKDIFEALHQAIDYFKIRLSIAIYKKKKQTVK